MARADLLDYLERLRRTPRRRLTRVERWRRRGWRHASIAMAADALAAEMHARDIGAGDRVGIYLNDGPVWAAALFGVMRTGATAVPIDVAHPADVVARIVPRLGLAAWLTDSELPKLDLHIPRLELGFPHFESSRAKPELEGVPVAAPGAMPPFPADDVERVAQLVLTSGTAYLPQSVAVKHANLRAVLDALESEIDAYRWLIRIAPRLRLAVSLPLSHLYGQSMGIFIPMALHADVAIIDKMPAAELAAALQRERAWVLASVPHTLSSLLDHLLEEGRRAWGTAELERRLQAAASLPWWRRCLLFRRLRRHLGRRMVAVVSGGATLDHDVERLWKRLGYVVVQGYGLTEAAPLVTLNHPFRARSGSIGKPLPGVEVRLAADGEILVRGRNVAQVSERGPRVDEQGWLHTGDRGEQLDDGSIRFRGRNSDRIVTAAGVNVDPAEIVAALRARDGVIDAAVVEQPWDPPGTPCAVLVVVPGIEVGSVVRRANEGLPDPARVRSWFVWPFGDLPRTPTGKVRRGEIVDWLKRRRATSAASAVALGAEAGGPGADAGGSVGDAGGSVGDAGRPGGDVGRPGGGAACAATGRDGIDLVLRAVTAGATELAGDTRIGDLLSSLDRVELAARIEDLYNVGVNDELFAGEQTISGLADGLRRSYRKRPRSDPEPDDPTTSPSSGPLAPTRPARPPRSREPDAAAWRNRRATRAARFALRECILHPLARALVRLESTDAAAIRDLHGPLLLASNHTSAIDPLVQFALPARLRRRLAPAARWNFFSEHRHGNWHYFWAVLGLNLIPLVQAGDWRPTLRIAGELVDRGHSILIYPEGEISKDGRIHAFQRGVAVMSRDLHLPVVPCATAGLERVLPAGRRCPARRGWKRPVVAFCLGDPLPAARPGDDLDDFVGRIERQVRRLHEQARALATPDHQFEARSA